MNRGADVLERSVVQPGKPFIKAGEENMRAYVIQNGEVCAYVIQDNQRIEIARFGPGTIIGEMCLMIDDPININYEAVVTTTVVTVTRQDFQKRLARADKTIKTILDHAIKKIEHYERLEMERAMKKPETVFAPPPELPLDATAVALVENLIKDLSDEKKSSYREAMLPHINGLICGIKALKSERKKT